MQRRPASWAGQLGFALFNSTVNLVDQGFERLVGGPLAEPGLQRGTRTLAQPELLAKSPLDAAGPRWPGIVT
jgi:hypothetical protein